MRVLIYSDVHGNLPAFEKVLEDAGKCDRYISLGDIVNYGPWSNECVDLALSLPNSIFLMGNHEMAFVDADYSGDNKLVKAFFNQVYPTFNRMNEIKQFVPQYKLNNYTCVHTLDDRNIYEDSDVDFESNFIIGHSHHQFHRKEGAFSLYNSGSVGQNRLYINLANYLVFDTDTNHIEMKACRYDVKLVIDKMIANNYPKECIQYYQNKKQI